ncbi:unnamed protein product, partial [Pylaiella littoralis]
CFSLLGSFVYTRAEYTYESMCFAVHAVGDCCLASGFTPWYAREKLFTSPAIMGSFCEGCHERVRFCCKRLPVYCSGFVSWFASRDMHGVNISSSSLAQRGRCVVYRRVRAYTAVVESLSLRTVAKATVRERTGFYLLFLPVVLCV